MSCISSFWGFFSFFLALDVKLHILHLQCWAWWSVSCELLCETISCLFLELHVLPVLIYETTSLTWSSTKKHSNFNGKINFAFQWQILTPNLCMGLEPSFLHFWSQFKISKVQAVSVSPPHTSTATTSAEDLYRCLQASFSNRIRFAYSAEANVFMVCHLDFIKGVGPSYYPVLEKSPIEAL